jgi:hypothetical protein
MVGSSLPRSKSVIDATGFAPFCERARFFAASRCDGFVVGMVWCAILTITTDVVCEMFVAFEAPRVFKKEAMFFRGEGWKASRRLVGILVLILILLF